MSHEVAGVVVREAVEADVGAFGVFFRDAWDQSGSEAPGFAGATDEVIAELTEPVAIRERIGGPDRRMFLAWDGDRVIGFSANRRVDDTTVELAGIIVLLAAAGRGVGTALVDAAVAAAHSDQYRVMIVRTETTNDRARAFYEARGFVVSESTTEQVEGTSIDVWELTRHL